MTKKKVETAIKKWCHPTSDIVWTTKTIAFTDEDGKEVVIKFKPDATSRAVTFRLLFDYIKGLDASEYLDAEVDYGEDDERGGKVGDDDDDDEEGADEGGAAKTAQLPTEAVAVSRFERLSYSRSSERAEVRPTQRGRGGPRRRR